MLVNLISSLNNKQASGQSSTSLENWYVSVENGGKYSLNLYPTPGCSTSKIINPTANSGTGVRGVLSNNQIMYIVSGDKFYTYTGGVRTLRGTLDTSTGYVEMGQAGNYLMIVTGGTAYYYQIYAGTFNTISDPDFPANSAYVTVQDGYFIVASPGTQKFYISDLEDPRSWQAINFASAVYSSDYLVRPFSFQKYLYLFGSSTTETWFNSGADFPFEPYQAVVQQYGLAAGAAICAGQTDLFFLSQSDNGGYEIRKGSGFDSKVISTDTENIRIAAFSTVADAYAYCYRINGHEFVCFTFPTADATIVYDNTTGQWHDRTSYYSGAYHYHRATTIFYFAPLNDVLMADSQSFGIYTVSPTTYTEVGNQIRRTIRSPILSQDEKMLSMSNLVVDVQRDIGGSSPVLSARISKDGGYSWGSYVTRSPGTGANRNPACVWSALGSARDFCIEITTTDAVNWCILGCRADVAGYSAYGTGTTKSMGEQ